MPDLPLEIGTKAVAVLPFAWNVPEDEAFARAMMLDLVDLLAGVEGLRVRGPRGTMSLAGAERDVRAIGQSLGVQAVVDGAVRRAGGRMQVVARLTAVVDGFQLWASRFERVDEDWFEAVAEVGRGVMGALTVRDRGVAVRPLVDPGRAAEYADARCLAFGARDAEAYTRLASMRAGDDARFLSLLAASELERSRAASGNEAQAARDRARAHATQAASLAPDLAASRTTLAHLALLDNALTEAARATRDALRLAPGNAEVQALFGRLLALVGRPRQGLTFLDAASTLEPTLESAWTDGLLVRGLLGEWSALERAIGAGPRSEARDVALARVALWHPDPGLTHAVGRIPGLAPRAASLIRTGQHADKVSAARAAASPGAPLALGQRIEALQLEVELLARMQEDDAALGAVQDAVQLGLTDVAWLERCPLLAPLSARLAPLVPEVARRAESVRLVLRTSSGRG
jgi:serine/threonine-protein kinase